MNQALESLRGQIGQLDRQILELLILRAELSQRIGRLKLELPDDSIVRPEIEEQKLQELITAAQQGNTTLNPNFITSLFYLIFRESSTIQMECRQNR